VSTDAGEDQWLVTGHCGDGAISKQRVVGGEIIHTSEQFQQFLKDQGINCSMSRSGNEGTTTRRWRASSPC
jgi:transposase InsO family protein